mmetsp:Transcript_7944/g.15765  ORF Transcript_7944/g.15765 Transcript_7944/m.15765 type:complete len:83 (+) Transcript_7944:114-362(+)
MILLEVLVRVPLRVLPLGRAALGERVNERVREWGTGELTLCYLGTKNATYTQCQRIGDDDDADASSTLAPWVCERHRHKFYK